MGPVRLKCHERDLPKIGLDYFRRPRRDAIDRACFTLKSRIVVVLICVNGLLAMSELAIVSSRPARLKTMIDRNVKGAGRALALGANPGKFLSTVQIGITLVGVLSGAFSGATLGARLAQPASPVFVERR